VIAAARRGEKVAMYTFDESLPIVFARARGLGFDLEELVDKGLVSLAQVDPAELSPGELSFRIRNSVENEGAKFVYIDSLNGYLHSMAEERHLNLQLHELLTYLNQLGVVTMLVVTPHGLLGAMQSSIDVTYLADTVLTLRFYEEGGAVHKAISVIKKRTGPHEDTIRELKVTSSGISVGAPLNHLRGVLSGVPVAVRPAKKPGSKRSRAHD
jgi:circadian clock protein KaiC